MYDGGDCRTAPATPGLLTKKTTRQITWTLSTKEPKINHVLAATSASNIKLYHTTCEKFH